MKRSVLVGVLLAPLVLLSACSSSNPQASNTESESASTVIASTANDSTVPSPQGATDANASDAENVSGSASDDTLAQAPTEPSASAATNTTATIQSTDGGADPKTSEQLLVHTISTADQECPKDLPAGAKCGVATVPLDWTNPNDESLEIWFAVRPAQTQPSTGTLIPFEGGPGGPISATIADYEPFIKRLTKSDTLYVDVRGVGRSSRISCAALDDAAPGVVQASPEAVVSACATELGSRRDFFNTVSSVLDIEAIRRALNLKKPRLAGFSYGTFVASIYTILFPDVVEATVLDGTFSVDTNPWANDVPRAIGESAALQCERSGDCSAQEMVQQLRDVAADLSKSPKTFAGRPGPFGESDLITMAQTALQSASKEFRAAIAAASDGDFSQLEALDKAGRALAESTAAAAASSESKASVGLSVAVICNDYKFPYEISMTPEQRFAELQRQLLALPQDAFGPFSAEGWIGAIWDHPDECLPWPIPATPQALRPPYAGPFPEVPVLLLNGDLDLQTPLDGAQKSQQQWPVSQFLLAPNGVHGLIATSPCLAATAAEFLQTKTLPEVDVCASQPIALPTAPPTSPPTALPTAAR
jgi:pimeloyl-ACP methyl ester carboxylesterase